SLVELRAYCKSLGEPEYRGGQIYHALYAERRFNAAGMTNLPGALREKMARYDICLGLVKNRISPQRTPRARRRKRQEKHCRSRRRWKRCLCPAKAGRRFAFRRRRVARWIAGFA